MCSFRNGLTVLPTSSEDILTKRGLISSADLFRSQLSFEGCWEWLSSCSESSSVSFRESLLTARRGRGEAVELEVEDGTGAWRCMEVIVEAEAEAETEGEGVEEVDVRDTAEVTGATVDESEEGRWPLTSEGLFMAQGMPNQGPWGKGSCAMKGLDIVTPCCRPGKSDWAGI